MTVLQTARLTIKPCCPDDAADFIALELDPEVMRYLNGGHAVDHATVSPDASFLMPRGSEPYVWTARHISNGDFVGWFCLWPEPETSGSKIVAELGYRLRRTAWGQGLAAEGAAALIDWGFDSAGYARIVACAMTVNLGSRRVMEKIGMTYDRLVPFEAEVFAGSEQGEVWYGLTQESWREKRTGG